MKSGIKDEENAALTVLAFSQRVGDLLCQAQGLPPAEAMRVAHDVFTSDMILAATLAALKNQLSLEDGAVYFLALYCQRMAEDIKNQGFFTSLIKRRTNLRNHQKAREVWLVISPIWKVMQQAGKTQFKKNYLELLKAT